MIGSVVSVAIMNAVPGCACFLLHYTAPSFSSVHYVLDVFSRIVSDFLKVTFKMEIDIKDLEGMTLLPLGDGRMAYVDKSGKVEGRTLSILYVPSALLLIRSVLMWTSLRFISGSVYMYGLKEELLEDQFETSFVEGDIYEQSDVGERGSPEFVLTSMLQDQVKLVAYNFENFFLCFQTTDFH